MYPEFLVLGGIILQGEVTISSFGRRRKRYVFLQRFCSKGPTRLVLCKKEQDFLQEPKSNVIILSTDVDNIRFSDVSRGSKVSIIRRSGNTYKFHCYNGHKDIGMHIKTALLEDSRLLKGQQYPVSLLPSHALSHIHTGEAGVIVTDNNIIIYHGHSREELVLIEMSAVRRIIKMDNSNCVVMELGRWSPIGEGNVIMESYLADDLYTRLQERLQTPSSELQETGAMYTAAMSITTAATTDQKEFASSMTIAGRCSSRDELPVFSSPLYYKSDMSSSLPEMNLVDQQGALPLNENTNSLEGMSFYIQATVDTYSRSCEELPDQIRLQSGSVKSEQSIYDKAEDEEKTYDKPEDEATLYDSVKYEEKTYHKAEEEKTYHKVEDEENPYDVPSMYDHVADITIARSKSVPVRLLPRRPSSGYVQLEEKNSGEISESLYDSVRQSVILRPSCRRAPPRNLHGNDYMTMDRAAREQECRDYISFIGEGRLSELENQEFYLHSVSHAMEEGYVECGNIQTFLKDELQKSEMGGQGCTQSTFDSPDFGCVKITGHSSTQQEEAFIGEGLLSELENQELYLHSVSHGMEECYAEVGNIQTFLKDERQKSEMGGQGCTQSTFDSPDFGCLKITGDSSTQQEEGTKPVVVCYEGNTTNPTSV